MEKRKEEKQVSLWMPHIVHFEGRIEAAKKGMNFKEYIVHLVKKDIEENKNKY